jgi:carboxymethylenebutenolidase
MKHYAMTVSILAAFGLSFANLPAVHAAAGLPPSLETAKQALEASPRHGEFAYIPMPGGNIKLKTWVVYPEVKEKAPVVIVIHEIFGMTDWVNSIADALAAEGFIAVAPDLISGMEGAEDNPRATIGQLTDEELIKRLDVVREYALALPAANGKLGCIGFCWGGKSTFLYATAQPKLDAAVVYYGTSPATEKLASVNAPVLGLYGENDERVNSTIPAAEEEMNRLGKPFEKEIYAGAGHGFLRQQSGQNGANLKATEQAWPRTIAFLRQHTAQ